MLIINRSVKNLSLKSGAEPGFDIRDLCSERFESLQMVAGSISYELVLHTLTSPSKLYSIYSNIYSN
jgi:hypothetical protein